MPWNQLALSHTTTVGTFAIVSLPGTSREHFIHTLADVLGAVTRPGLQRDTNVESQELLVDETTEDENICLWSLRFRGIHAPDEVRAQCEAMYKGVREQLEIVGTRASFDLATLEGAWEAD